MTPHQALQTLNDARDLMALKAYPEALEVCQNLLRRKGPKADVYTLQALIHQQAGQIEEAGKSMDMALAQQPNHPSMLFTAALINRKLKNFDLAKMQAMKAAREAQDNPQIICQCAMILGSLREPKQALKILEKLLQKDKNQAEPWYLVGKYQQELGNSEAAEYALKKCLTLQPDHAKASKLLQDLTQAKL